MKNYQDSDYAANKYASGIVYRFANQTVMVTLANYLCENPDKTEADFNQLKALSDGLYLQQVRADNVQSKRAISFHVLEETTCCAVPSPEDTYIEAEQEAEKQAHRQRLTKEILSKLTDVQRRRYLLYYVHGLTMRQIAEKEGVLHSKVQKSLLAAEKKIKNILADN